jgi:hypothetical protein
LKAEGGINSEKVKGNKGEEHKDGGTKGQLRRR